MGSFALWIIPEGEAYALTDDYIARLSAGYNLPKFEPHVTLLSGILSPEALALRDLAEGLPVGIKREMIRALGEISEIEFDARQLPLARASAELPVSSWKVMEQFPLAKVL